MRIQQVPSLLLAFVFAITTGAGAHAQSSADAIAQASPEARAAWARIVAASSGDDPQRTPITAFVLRADGRTNSGTQTNELNFEYKYLAPHCISFALPQGGVSGRSGLKQREYWNRTKDGLVELAGFEYVEDRRQVQQMHSLARNFVALTDPAKLTIKSLELLPEPPPELWKSLKHTTRHMQWIRLRSPDFALSLREGEDGPSKEGEAAPDYVVDLALPDSSTTNRTKDLPNYAIIRESPTASRPTADPMLIRLYKYTNQNGFLMPLNLQVFPPAVGAGPQMTFSSKPAQEVWVQEADLRPSLTVADFAPTE